MRLTEIMSTPARTIAASTTAQGALDQMRKLGIHHLIVEEHGEPVGFVSEWALTRSTSGSVADLMQDDLALVAPNDTVRDAANRLRGRGTGVLAVMENNRLVGVVTISDLLETLGRGVEKAIPHASRPRTLRSRGPRQKAVQPVGSRMRRR